jgi:polyisoprenoid-binding protein YceI
MKISIPPHPALSPRERAHRQALSRISDSHRIADRQATILPLPRGEGRGEGKQEHCHCNSSTLAIAWITFNLAAAFILAGCAKNPAEGKTAAEVKAPSTNAVAKTAARSYARTYTLTGDSTIGFFASKVTGSHNGGFKKFSGEFALADGSITGSGHQVVIEMDSTWADNPRLTGHLKSQDFFNVAVFPQATFELTSSEKIEGSKVKVTGNLTLHGVTKQISFPAELTTEGDRAALKAEFFIKRFDFAIKYPGKANDLIRDEVVIKLDVKAVAKA